MNKSILIAVLFSLIVGTAQAATAGSEFEIERADAFQQGVTTIDEAKIQLGNPVSVSSDAEGNQLVWWKYVKVNVFGRDVRKLAVVFDKDGKMTRIAHREVLK